MILKKEFYFIRHGQTDYNASNAKIDHADVSLNATGFKQVLDIEPLISRLPIRSVCYSPLKRAKETKEAISLRLQANHYEIEELGECSRQIWEEMTAHNPVQQFMERVLAGINKALSYEGPVLVVAHGGTHFALCSLMGVTDHEWIIDNCLPVHFFPGTDGQWKTTKICFPLLKSSTSTHSTK